MPPRQPTQHTASRLLAAFGHQPFQVADADELGISRDQIRQAAAAGLLSRPWRGWYAVPSTEGLSSAVSATLQQLQERDVRAVVAGSPASRWWQLDEMGPARPPLLLIDPRSGMRAGMRNGVLIRHAVLPESHIVKAADGTLYTSALRTGIDCARGLDPVSAFIVLNSALRRSLDHAIGRDGRQLTSHQLTDLASDPECARAAIAQLHAILRGCGGHGLRAPRLAMRFVDPRLETALEGLSWWRFNERGFLIPVPQQWVRGASGCLYRVDFGCGRVVGEADGAVKYKDPKDLQQEKSRQTDIELGGHPVVRWGWIEMWHRPDSVIEALRRAAG